MCRPWSPDVTYLQVGIIHTPIGNWGVTDPRGVEDPSHPHYLHLYDDLYVTGPGDAVLLDTCRPLGPRPSDTPTTDDRTPVSEVPDVSITVL